jgi:hypothetical protein
MVTVARAMVSSQVRDYDRRSAPRVDFGRPGTVRIGDAPPVEASISDLTREGCRLITDATLAPGQQVQVGIAHLGLTAGQIVWYGENGYGCKFDAPLAPGAITRASGPSNVTALHGAISSTNSAVSTKLGLRARLAVIVGASIVGWGAVFALAVFLLS